MKNLFEIIAGLNKAEKRHFKLYLNRVAPYEGENLVVNLFDAINKKQFETENEIAEYFYPENKNAYYRLKNRLLESLEKSLLLLHHTASDRAIMSNLMRLAEIYTKKSLYKLAYQTLVEAEEIGLKGGNFDMLTNIYAGIISISFYHPEINIEDYLKKQRQNLTNYTDRISIAQLIHKTVHALLQTNYERHNTDIEYALQQISEQLNINKTVATAPKVQFDVSNTIRRILLQNNDYEALESFLIANLAEFEARKMYKRDTHQNKIVQLVWLINTLLRNGKINLMPSYTQQLYDALLAYNKLFYPQFEWTYYQCIVAQYFYTNHLKDGILLLENLAQTRHDTTNMYYKVFIHGNLAVILYCRQQLPLAMQAITPLLTKDIYNKLSGELQLRISLLEVILHLDNNDWQYVAYRLGDIKQSNKALLKQANYQHEAQFIKLLSIFSMAYEPFNDPKIKAKIEQYISSSPVFRPGSNEFISYMVWLKSKLSKNHYYLTLLANVKTV